MKTTDRASAPSEVSRELNALETTEPGGAALVEDARSSPGEWFGSEPAHPASATLHQDLETSRAKLLKALVGATDITLIRSFGNIGDQLIYAGTRQLLADTDHRELSLLQLEGARGQLAVITGGGAWCQAHQHLTQYLPRIEAQFERVVIFPSSFEVAEESVRQALTATKALVFAREPVSYEQIRELCQADLAHDSAFFFDYRPYAHAGHGLLTAYRTDRETAGHSLPLGNNDISHTCESLDEWLWTIARHETVETDRAHVMIAAALLGKRVYYRASNYHKVPAIAAFALGDRAVTQLGEGRAEVVKEQLLRQGRALAARLPADFVATHPELAVTVVMLSHGRLEQTLNAIRALQKHVRIPFKLLLVDNDSGAEVQRQLAAVSHQDERIELLLLDENLGCAGGRAYALARVTTPYALLIDNDVEVMPGAVEHLLHYTEQEAEAAAVMGKIVLPDGALHLCGADYRVVDGVLHFELLGSGRRFDEAIGASGPCRWVSGTLTLVRTAVFARHPYDLGLRHYYEDLEWCYRLNEAGAGAFHRCVEALAIHDHKAKGRDAALSATEQRRQAIKYVTTIAHFYRQHGVIIPNLFDFVPELRTADGQFHLVAARLLLALVNAYGDEWALAQWEAGQLAPLFAAPAIAPSRVAALEAELAGRTSEMAALATELAVRADEAALLKEELAVSRGELNRRQHELDTLQQLLAENRSEIAALNEQAATRGQAWDQLLAQTVAREQQLAVIFKSRSWRVIEFYWRARRALRRLFTP